MKNKISVNNKADSLNYKIKIKPEVRDHMIRELYAYLKKKIKKNTLKLIIEDQIDIKNLKNKISLLKHKEINLKIYYVSLKKIRNFTSTTIQKIDKKNLLNNLGKETIINEQLSTENKELKVNLNEQKLKLEESLEKNRPFEINNHELKNTISKYIVNNKKMQERINFNCSNKFRI